MVGDENGAGHPPRHTAHFKRWRTDRDPETCGYGQLDEPAGYDLTRILSTEPGGA